MFYLFVALLISVLYLCVTVSCVCVEPGSIELGPYLGIFLGRAGLEKSPMQKMLAQARPGPTVGPEISAQTRPGLTVGPEISAQAQPMGAIFCRVIGLSGRAFLKSSIFLAQARPS
jgi:hypothetical protein